MNAENLQHAQPFIGKSRSILIRRLIDVVSMPADRMPPQDRNMAGDILLDMLMESGEKEHSLCARRLQEATEAPRRVLRYLAQCHIEIARPLLEDNTALDSADLSHVVQAGSDAHRDLIASRANLDSALCEKLAEFGGESTLRNLLRNRRSTIPESAMDVVVVKSRKYPELTNFAVKRTELAPSQALAMFWWAEKEARRHILLRHAADRKEMINLCEDLFQVAAQENWQDAVTRKALQMMERRQRNRAAIDKSPYESLDDAVKTASESGLNAELAQEIGYLAGVKPVTVAKILSDPGGEGIAVICKATGLKRHNLGLFWNALRRPQLDENGAPNAQFKNVSEIYEMMSVPKAQTILRYWNWALTSAYSIRKSSTLGHDIDADQSIEHAKKYSASQRAARLVFGS